MYLPLYFAIALGCVSILLRYLNSVTAVLIGSDQKISKLFRIPILLCWFGMLCCILWAFTISWWAPILIFFLFVIVWVSLRYEVAERLFMSARQRKELEKIVIREKLTAMMGGDLAIDPMTGLSLEDKRPKNK